jgi:hypothetical protein
MLSKRYIAIVYSRSFISMMFYILIPKLMIQVFSFGQMTAMKAANKELKGMMKTVKLEDIDSLQDEMMDLMDVSNEIQETLGRSYNVPDDIDEEELMGGMDLIFQFS